MKNNIKFEKVFGGGHNLKKVLLISLVVIGATLILLNNFSHAAFTSSMSVPLVNGNINYKHPDFKIVSMFQKNTDGTYTEVNTMPSGDEYKINEIKSYCNKGFTEEKDTKAVLKTVSGNHVMNNLTKNDRCTIYFDPLPILANSWFDKQGTENAITKPDVESITTLDKINIPDNAIKSWDASEANNGSVMAYYTDTDSNGKYELYLAGDDRVVAPKDSYLLFGANSNENIFKNVTTIDLSKLDTSNVTNMKSMFIGMSSLTSLDLSSFDTSNVTNMYAMFSGMRNLTSIDVSNFDTSKVTDMCHMFESMSKITSLNLSNFDTSNVTDMSFMFNGNYKLTNLNIRSFDTSNVTSMYCMFAHSGFTNLDLSSFNTSKVTTMYMMFWATDLSDLNISHFDTRNVKSMYGMFGGMSNLTNLDLSNFDTSNVTNMGSMFRNCSGLTNLDISNFYTSNVTNMSSMFYGMGALTNLNMSLSDFSNVTSYTTMFNSNTKLNAVKVKDITAKTFIEARLSDASKTGVTVTIAS